LSRLPGFDAEDALDPTARSTFEMAKLGWSQRDSADAVEMLAFYKSLLNLRHQRIVPLLQGVGAGNASFRRDGRLTIVEWTLAAGSRLHMVANLADQPATIPAPLSGEQIFLLGSVRESMLAPWSVYSSISPARG
jgi:1,4-alpha-glucan branching enzyme/maltooligosyltrehalose trehalohydrolase